MHRGYIKLWRKAFDSPVWSMPLLYSRVWFWLLGNVNHQDNETIVSEKKYSLKAGQKLTSLQHIAEAVAYPEWGKLIVPNKRTISKILNWLESNEMATVESNGLGTVVSICNWQDYQEEKVTTHVPLKVTTHVGGMHTNKNDKNDNNKEKDNTNVLSKKKVFVKPNPDEVTAYSNEIGYPLDGHAWCDCYEQTGWMCGRNHMKDWKAAVRNWKRSNYKTGGQSNGTHINGAQQRIEKDRNILDGNGQYRNVYESTIMEV